MRACFAAVLCLCCASFAAAQAEWPRPKWEQVEALGCRGSEEKAPIVSKVGNYQVRIVGAGRHSTEPGCKAYLSDKAGKQTLLLQDFAISIHQGTGEDLFGDGNQGLVLEGFSGGAHCCYTYRIADLGERPVILGAVQNETPFYFFRDKASGQYRIMTSDGAFDYFDDLCHACTPFPRVVLQATADGLRDVSPQFTEQYDSEIAFARAKIAQGEAGKFVESDFRDARPIVLEIAFSYLYSGRDAQAWQVLDEMWPAHDRERIKKLIVDTRAKGLLSKLEKTRPVPTDFASYAH